MSKKEIEKVWNDWWDITNTLEEIGEIVNMKIVYPTFMIDVKEENWECDEEIN